MFIIFLQVVEKEKKLKVRRDIKNIYIQNENERKRTKTNENERKRTKNKKQKTKNKKQKTKNKKQKNTMACFYDNQTEASNKIVEQFNTGIHYIMLDAKMQSGKTGTALYTAFTMLISKKVNSVVIISGNNDTMLKTQWEANIPIHLEVFSDHLLGVPEIYREGELAKMEKKIRVVFRQDLEKNIDLLTREDNLILWDESHFATGENQTIHNVFNRCGITDSVQGDTMFLRSNRIYILSITASRCAERARLTYNNSAGINWKTVIMETGDNYYGIVEFRNLDLINPIDTPLTNTGFWANEFKYLKDSRKYIIIRSYESAKTGYSNTELIKEIARKNNMKYFALNSHTPKERKNILESIPEKTTIVHVAGMLRMGKELKRDNVGIVMETTGTKHNTLAQGLFGRVCGYYTNGPPSCKVYLPKKSTHEGMFVDEYCEMVESAYKTGMSNTSYTPKRKHESDKRIGTKVMLIRRDDDEEDMEFLPAFYDRMTTTERNVEICKYALNKLENIDMYTEQEKISIRSLLNQIINTGGQANNSLFRFTNSHKSDGTKNNDKEKRVKEWTRCVRNKIPFEYKKGKSTPSVNIEKVTRDFNESEGGYIKKNDYTIGFMLNIPRTNNLSGPDVLPSNKKDIFHTQRGREIPSSTKNNKHILKHSLKQIVDENNSLKSITSNSDDLRQSLLFSEEEYGSINSIENIISELNIELNINIRIIKKRGRRTYGYIGIQALIW